MYLLHEIERDLGKVLSLYANMRWLFNHGISASELYSGDMSDICDKDYRWFINNFSYREDNLESYFGSIFMYSIDIIISYVIENKVRFVGPKNLFYIDFEIFQDEEFKRHRQLGRMQDIDLIEADFTGYQLTYFYRYSNKDSRYRKTNFYIGSKHREKFLNKVNSGEKMYSVKDVKLEYFLPQIYKKFPKLSKKEIKKILMRGYFRMYYAIKQRCYITLRSKMYNISFFVGTFYKSPERQITEYSFRMRKKLIKIAKWKKTEYDNSFYIAISKSRMADWVALNNKNDRAGWIWLEFKDVIASKQLESALYNSVYSYIFRIKVKKKYTKRWVFRIEDKKYRDPAFIGIAINYKLQPATIHWKELIKGYNEEGNSQHI